MISLKTLIRLQATFAAASLLYLFASALRGQIVGEPLSAAPLLPSILMFVVYSACLLLPRTGRIGGYRIAMIVALLLFGVGGVAGNIWRYFDSGLAQYASFGAWLLAVVINAYGTVLNIIAVAGAFRNDMSHNRP